MEKVRAFRASDYAGLEIKEKQLVFYFGYEETWCKKHHEKECECDDREDCFVVKKKGKEIMRIPESKLSTEGIEDMAHGLVLGIGHYLAKF